MNQPRRRRYLAIGLAALAVMVAGATSAAAIPVSVKSTSVEGDRLYVDFNYWLPYTATGNPSFYSSIWTSGAHPRRVRAAGRHEIQSDYGPNIGAYATFPYISALRAGTYWACIRGVAQLDNGTVTAHTACRRFSL